jgi:hypothetical protein
MNLRRPHLLAHFGQQPAADRVAARPVALADDELDELDQILARPAVTWLGPAGSGVTS